VFLFTVVATEVEGTGDGATGLFTKEICLPPDKKEGDGDVVIIPQ
jgi:hypothetical protein